MIVQGGIGSGLGSRAYGAADLTLPLAGQDLGFHWVFGRGDREDLAATADTVAARGIRHSAAERQAALETLFARFVSGAHAGALDDAQVVVPEEAVVSTECLVLHEIMREKIERLRFDTATLPIFETELRSLGRLAIEQILAGPVLQWRNRLTEKFLAVAHEAREFALTDTLRDIPAENVDCQQTIGLSRLRIALERFL